MKQFDVLAAVKGVLETSALVRSSREAHAGKVLAYRTPLRRLPDVTIELLEKNGCTAQDWSRILAPEDFDPSRVRNVSFFGDVRLGSYHGTVVLEAGAEVPTGIYGSSISNCEIGDDVLIKDVKWLANYIVKQGAVLFNDGVVAVREAAVFGNGSELPLGIETGGRDVRIYAEITVEVAESIARSSADGELLESYNDFVDGYVKEVTCDRGTIEKGARILNTPKVIDAYVGEGARIDNARLVVNATVLSSTDEVTEISDGAYVRDSLLQWGCEVTSLAIVDHSVLTEHSHVERHGKLTDSLLGPNSGLGEGEVTASLCGPFVGFHHQALLIAAFWPEGKGNVGYGANVGSNHTSKAPDQEIWPGEGAFFGLGTNIKFPSDFSRAPYTIIASGVSTLPQKVTFPFSLINSPRLNYEGISPAYNEIFPGWVLSDNIFTLRRNEGKYKARNKARRMQFDFDVFRPDTVEMMLDARQRLEVAETREIYTDRDIPGLGKNYMLEAARREAIESYTFYIRYYALMGLKKKLEELVAGGKEVDNILESKSDEERWEGQRQLLAAELPAKSVKELLAMLSEAQERIARDTQASKEKDDVRGQRIIEDYAQTHPPAAEDSFVKETWEETRKLEAETEALLGKLY